MPYPVIITLHARERWVERIVDPRHYHHLRTCTGCEKCNSLIRDLQGAIRYCGKQIDRVIAGRFKTAKENGKKVVDVSFLEAFKKQHGSESEEYDFYQSGNAVFVVRQNSKEGEPPILITVLSEDMIDGTVIRTMNSEELKSVFKRWKFERRQDGK